MNRRRRCIAEILERRVMLTGSITEFPTDVMPVMSDGMTTDTARNMLLLPNGSVLFDTGDTNANWYVLKPNPQGNYLPLPIGERPAGYVLPTITATGQDDFGRYAYASDVLPNGDVFVAGGENTQTLPDGSGGSYPKNDVEIYNPITGDWSPEQDPFITTNSSQVGNMDDAVSEVLSPDGTVIVGDKYAPQAQVFNPSAPSRSQWSYNSGLLKTYDSDEETWVKLPGNGGILTCAEPEDGGEEVFERFVDGQWITDSAENSDSPTLDLWSANSVDYGDGEHEIGPALLLPNGNVLFIGATGNTVEYTPPADPTDHGSWTAGPNFTTDGTNTLQPWDAPAALEPNGDVLFIAGYGGTFGNSTASELLEWDGNLNDLPAPVLGVPSDFSTYTFIGAQDNIGQQEYCMLDLPNGQILISNGETGHLFIYQPDGYSADTPQVSGIVYNGSKFTMTGTQLNGMSEGSSFGDDLQNATNYPIVDLTGPDNQDLVQFATTSDWSSVGVQTGSTPVTTNFSLPSGMADGSYLMSVSASGISTANTVNNVLFIQMSSSNVYSERLVKDGSNIDLYENGATTTPSASYAESTFNGIVVYGLSGSCTLTVDMSGGNPVPVIGYLGLGISFQGAATGNTVKFAMVGDATSFTTGSSFTITDGSTSPPEYSQVTLTNVQSLEFDADSGDNSIVESNSPGTIPLTLYIAAGAVAAMAQTVTPDSVTLYVSSLAIATNTGGSPTGQLDLGDNEMLLTYGSGTDPMSTIYTDLQSGYNSGAWTGNGIESSAAADDSTHKTAIGYADSASANSPNSIANSILLEYTVYGDTNLNGTVDINDYNAVVRNYGDSPALWDQGNFYYETSVGIDDYNTVVRNFGDTV